MSGIGTVVSTIKEDAAPAEAAIVSATQTVETQTVAAVSHVADAPMVVAAVTETKTVATDVLATVHADAAKVEAAAPTLLSRVETEARVLLADVEAHVPHFVADVEPVVHAVETDTVDAFDAIVRKLATEAPAAKGFLGFVGKAFGATVGAAFQVARGLFVGAFAVAKGFVSMLPGGTVIVAAWTVVSSPIGRFVGALVLAGAFAAYAGLKGYEAGAAHESAKIANAQVEILREAAIALQHQVDALAAQHDADARELAAVDDEIEAAPTTAKPGAVVRNTIHRLYGAKR